MAILAAGQQQTAAASLPSKVRDACHTSQHEQHILSTCGSGCVCENELAQTYSKFSQGGRQPDFDAGCLQAAKNQTHNEILASSNEKSLTLGVAGWLAGWLDCHKLAKFASKLVSVCYQEDGGMLHQNTSNLTQHIQLAGKSDRHKTQSM